MALNVNGSANGSKDEKQSNIGIDKEIGSLKYVPGSKVSWVLFSEQWCKSEFGECELLFTGSLLTWTVLQGLVSIYKTTIRRGFW